MRKTGNKLESLLPLKAKPSLNLLKYIFEKIIQEDCRALQLMEKLFLIKNILSIAHKRNETFENHHQSGDNKEAKMELTINQDK